MHDLAQFDERHFIIREIGKQQFTGSLTKNFLKSIQKLPLFLQ